MNDGLYSDAPRPTARRGGNGRYLALALVVALAAGGAAAVWAGSQMGWIEIHRSAAQPKAVQTALVAPSPTPSAANVESAQTALGVRMAELEQRMTKLNLEAEAASGNAARAEGLLIASAARRSIERGAPLGYLGDQLKLRFGNAQPNAVDTLIEVSANPVTLDALEQGLDRLGGTLVEAPRTMGTLARLTDELAHLFVIRRADAPSPAPQHRLDRARMFLATGRTEAAIGEVQRMPGHAAASQWIALAQRYVRAQRALDLIETAAIVEPRGIGEVAAVPVAPPSSSAPAGTGSF